jgi:hypothetical protein
MSPDTTPMMVKGSISRWVMPGWHWDSYMAMRLVLSSFTSRYSTSPGNQNRGGDASTFFRLSDSMTMSTGRR